jgi:3-phenylpropionate/cinnamic acid dioxygenase small subunit
MSDATADRLAIIDNLTSYCMALDTKDWDRLLSTFTDDAEADYGDLGPAQVGAAEITAGLRGVVEPLDTTFHLIGNFMIDLDGDSATSTTYLFAQHVFHEAVGGPIFHVTLIYHDTHRRTADGWKIASRRLQPIWTDGNGAVAAQARAKFEADGG